MRNTDERVGSMFGSHRAAGVMAVASFVVLAACGGNDTATEDTRATTSTMSELTTTTTVPPTTAGTDDDRTDDDDATAGTGAARGRCRTLTEVPGGVYSVDDAGEIHITSDGSTVRLVETRPAEGWTATGDTEDDDDEVEVVFRSGNREVEFEAELDDGRLEVEVCDS
jgi:hypothetical protein